jgi:glycolate oxidase iron-sulfur subunit
MGNLLKDLDYSVVQQCMHCGMCLPSCPTYQETGRERNSPRGRIALMRAIADDELAISRDFGDEMYYCLGCLACTTACPAGVDYPLLFEHARAEVEEAGVMPGGNRKFWRWISLRVFFRHQRLLHLAGRVLRIYQKLKLDKHMRRIGFIRLLPESLRRLEPKTPAISPIFSDRLIAADEMSTSAPARYQVGLLTGCIQDITFSEVNRDTADVLLENGCQVITPRLQGCCGSLHAHNGDLKSARELARRLIDLFDLDRLDAVISNAAGCGSHLKHFGRLLEDDPDYADLGRRWDAKLRDASEWLVEIGFRAPKAGEGDGITRCATYHDACHLCHGQGLTSQPRQVLEKLPGFVWKEMNDSTRCCGSAGIYSITQPEQAEKLLSDKISNITKTGAEVVAMANPGCHLQIQQGMADSTVEVRHVISLLAEAYRKEEDVPNSY